MASPLSPILCAQEGSKNIFVHFSLERVICISLKYFFKKKTIYQFATSMPHFNDIVLFSLSLTHLLFIARSIHFILNQLILFYFVQSFSDQNKRLLKRRSNSFFRQILAKILL